MNFKMIFDRIIMDKESIKRINLVLNVIYPIKLLFRDLIVYLLGKDLVGIYNKDLDVVMIYVKVISVIYKNF